MSSKEQADLLRSVFEEIFAAAAAAAAGEPGTDAAGQEQRPESPASAADVARAHALAVQSVRAQDGDDAPPADEDEVSRPYLGSPVERLAGTDFAELSESELAELAALMRQITLAVPERRSRRHRPGSGGRSIDLRASLRRARRTGGTAFRLIGRVPLTRPRRLVVLCDISGSMEPYARAMLQLLYCAAGGARAEVFSFATRLTRLTPALAKSSPAEALRQGRPGGAGLAGRHPARRGAEGVQRRLRPARHGQGRGGPDHLRRLGHRRPRDRPAGDGAAVAGRLPHRVGQPAHQERRVRAAGRRAWRPRGRTATRSSAGTQLQALRDLTAALADPVRRRAELRPAA